MNETEPLMGVFTEDPATKMPIGSTIQLRHIDVIYEGKENPAVLSNWTTFNGVLLAICLKSADSVRIVGSAAMVAPGIAVYAHHVVESILRAVVSGDPAAYCFGLAPSGIQIWKARKITHIKDTDLGIIGLERASNFEPGETLYQSKVTTRLPKVGEDLLICGFRAASSDFGANATEFAGRVIVSRGAISARYPFGRDSVMMPWPCVEVSCSSFGGMSGGPVYDKHGRLVGVLSSSIGDSIGGNPSYVSLIWPALITKFDGGWPPGLIKERSRLVDLDPALCGIDKPQALNEHIDPLTGDILVEYRPWE
jgi:hypothetical protein